MYQALIASGDVPSKEEARIAASVKLYLVTFCDQVDTLVRVKVPAKNTIRQPQRIRVQQGDGSWHNYYKFQDFEIIQDPGNLYPHGLRNPEATITVGPLYRRKGMDGVFMPNHEWLMRKDGAHLTMHHLWGLCASEG